MTDEQFYAKDWLNRMYQTVRYIESLERKREVVLSSLSGIGRYDAENIPGGNGENSTETKNIEYSILSEQIDKERQKLSTEDIRTLNVIGKLENTPEGQLMKAILIDRYLTRLPWEKITEKQNYSSSRLFELHAVALSKIYKYIPREAIVHER